MAMAASKTLLALFVTFCAPGCGWTGKTFIYFFLSRCVVCTNVLPSLGPFSSVYCGFLVMLLREFKWFVILVCILVHVCAFIHL